MRVEFMLDSILGDSTETDTVMYRNEYADVRVAIDSALSGVDSNMLVYYTHRDSAFAYALWLNDSIATNNTVEYNRKAMNKIMLGYTLGYDTAITDTDVLALLYDIAFQCPLQGGKGVYMARSILALSIDTVYDDDTLCAVGYTAKKGGETAKAIEKLHVKNARMYPNPASNHAYVEFSGCTAGYVKITMTDIAGRKVLEDIVQAVDGRYKINTVPFADGLYFVNLYDGEESVFSDKLNIITR